MILGFPPLFPPFGNKDLQKKLIDLQNALHESGQKKECGISVDEVSVLYENKKQTM